MSRPHHRKGTGVSDLGFGAVGIEHEPHFDCPQEGGAGVGGGGCREEEQEGV